MSGGWIGVDLDGTLAHYDGWKGAQHIGEPIAPMVERVRAWIAQGTSVKIMTARANNGWEQIQIIQEWCAKHIGCSLPVTAMKDFQMVELWDDRVVQVIPNTGLRADGVA